MAHKIAKYWRIVLVLQRNNFMTTAAYKQNFILMTVAVAIVMAFNIIFLKVIFGYINNIAGWNYYELLIVIGSVMVVEGILWIFGARMGALGQSIRQGTLDGLLVKPADTQFLISFWNCDHEDVPRVMIGGLLVYYGVSSLNLDIQTALINLFFYLILLINAVVVAYSLTLILKTMYFWTIVDYSLHSLIEAISQISKYPTDIFTSFYLRSLFTILLPLAFIATVPAKVLARGFDWWLVLGSCAMAIIFFTFSRKLWLFALKHYQSASS